MKLTKKSCDLAESRRVSWVEIERWCKSGDVTPSQLCRAAGVNHTTFVKGLARRGMATVPVADALRGALAKILAERQEGVARLERAIDGAAA
jgi:hypothetical protein